MATSPLLPVTGPLPAAVPAALTAEGTTSTGETVLFAVVALITVCCGVGVLTARRAVTAAINMIGIMISLATLYVANEAPFLGVTQVVVYTGAVMTLVLFVIMLVGVGGDEPTVAAGGRWATWFLAAFGAGLTLLLGAVVIRSGLPGAVGLADGALAAPSELAPVLFGPHVVTMEITGLLLVVAALGALALTHRQRVRPRLTQRGQADAKMRAYAERGAHPGQKPMPGVFAATNSAAAPALSPSGRAVEESVPRVLRARGLDLEVAEVSPEYAAAARAGNERSREDVDLSRSGMASMPGAAAPRVAQPVAGGPSPQALEPGESQGSSQAARDEQEEEK